MSNSNVIYLRKWFEKTPPLSEQRNCFASTRETLELLKAFSRIESAFLRGTIISAAREAAFAGSPSEPPKNSAQPPTFPRTCAISPNLLLPADAQQAHWDS
jgi:hypothetical protein